VAVLGAKYRDYQSRVPMLIPWPRRLREAAVAPAEPSS
jgi:hypothetical protein